MVTNSLVSKPQRVVVTGGAGFIGSHLVDVLLEHKHSVFVMDNLSYGKRQFLPVVNKNLQFAQVDILNLPVLKKVFADFQPTLLYHLAAIHHIPTCETQPLLALRVNVQGTQSILMVAAQTQSLRRIVFASSGAVYETLDEPLTETSPVVPHDIYATSKVAGEHLLEIATRKAGLQGIVSRLFNAVGPRETNPHLVPEILTQVSKGERHVQIGNLKPRRNYMDVRDAAEALYILGQAELPVQYDVFNVASEQEYSVQEILDLLSDLLGYRLIPAQSAGKIRKIDRPSQKADISKIRQQLAWQPQRSLRDSLRDVLKEAGRMVDENLYSFDR